MRIAIIGTGNVGSVLGRRWTRGGHTVHFGVRDTESQKVQDLLSSIGSNATASSLSEAAADAEVVLLAVPWAAAEETIEALGDLAGKVLIDCTNPIAPGMKGLSVGRTTSAAEEIARFARGARVVKAFSTTGSKNMEDPIYADGPITMFVAGDDTDAKQQVRGLVEEIGFEVCDAGGLHAARFLEPLALLWVHLAYVEGQGPDFAIKIVRR